MRLRRIQFRRYWIAYVAVIGSTICAGLSAPSPSFTYTEASEYDGCAWRSGAERFPEGSQIRIAPGGRALADGFFAMADPDISFDGRRALFAGKRRREDSWQIWEVPLHGGEPVPITRGADCIRPLYLPDDQIAVSRKYGNSFQLAILGRLDREPLRITYLPGSVLASQVLQDGRILFEAEHPSGSGGHTDLYAVYSDGSGVEAIRCDHGHARQGPRQLASGDVVFATQEGLARFTSARAQQLAVPAPSGEIAGPIGEVASDRWLLSLRRPGESRFALVEWSPKTGRSPKSIVTSTMHALQPMPIAARNVPPRHPSGLHDRERANLLCLNAYESPYEFANGSITGVRVFTQDAAGRPALLGQTTVESDGSFFIHVPTERPLKIELTGADGQKLAGEHGWFWMRRGEQRICVGCHAGPERAPDNVVPQVLLRRPEPVSILGEGK